MATAHSTPRSSGFVSCRAAWSRWGALALASNSVTTFAINPLTGVLSAVGGATATGIGPGGIAILRALD